VKFGNVYEDRRRAEAYAELEFRGTYYLAYRDLPEIISRHVNGTKALDFGCGTGRSTRFLEEIGFDATGVDVAENMLRQARAKDPEGDYRLVKDGELSQLTSDTYDLVLAAFTFDNIPSREMKVKNLSAISSLLKPDGAMVNLVSSPEIYTHEWASFTTKDFPENRYARSGDKVRIIMTDVEDQRPVEDILWSDEAYREVYESAGLELVETCRPLAKESEPFNWVSETRVAPWVIYVLKKVPGHQSNVT
jgi:ubiquinone/menaquinone biosynthesis C-methylase UbiE